MYKIETPGPEVYPVLLDIWEASVNATHHFLDKEDITFFKKTIQEHNIFAQVELVVAKDSNDKILGFMGVAGNNLEMIFLDPAARSKGLGKLLLNYAIDKLKIDKVDANEQNEDALGFYKHFGFKVASRSPLDGTGKPYPILHMQLGE